MGADIIKLWEWARKQYPAQVKKLGPKIGSKHKKAHRPPHNAYCEPAATLIEKFATSQRTGVQALAQGLGLSQSTVHRWRVPRNKNGYGCGGHIPVRYHDAIKSLADTAGIKLTNEDFMGAKNDGSRRGTVV